MACLEATTSPAVKRMLVDTVGTDQWVGAGKAINGMASGRSQLGADIHEIDNSASRCGRLLDEVAGDADAVATRRAEIIAAMGPTAAAVLRRRGRDDLSAVAAALRRVGHRGRNEHRRHQGARLAVAGHHLAGPLRGHAAARGGPAGRPKTAPSQRFSTARARRCWSSPTVRSPRCSSVSRMPPRCCYTRPTPRSSSSCVQDPGKPVNFVPVIDKDVRRWWRSDSLWQAHDARYTADQGASSPVSRPSPASPGRRAGRGSVGPFREGRRRRGAPQRRGPDAGGVAAAGAR